ADVRMLDDHTFQTEFPNVRTTLDFVFEFTDTDNVVGLRHVIIKPLDDTAPDVDVQVEVVRKTNQGFMVSPKAVIPFSGKVRDDHGLVSADYACTVTRMDSGAETGGRALLLLSALYQLVGGPGQDLRAAAEAVVLSHEKAAAQPTAEPEVQRV